MRDQILQTILTIPGILIGFTVHEYAHAKVADKLGDPTPRAQGRLTLSPIPHIDPIGFLALLLFHFGWAKPVQVNPRNFKNYNKDDLKVNIAGVMANLFTAAVFGLLAGIFALVAFKGNFLIRSSNTLSLTWIIYRILGYTVQINCMLSLFNLLPLPGLDGFNILRNLAPAKFYKIEGAMYRYSFVIMIILVMPIYGGTSIIGLLLSGPVGAMTKLFLNII
ncbi:site-2 protease family protein [Clostridium cellulovorans]|nr:site-2 protease family protein [Clostridium cellulovorans]